MVLVLIQWLCLITIIPFVPIVKFKTTFSIGFTLELQRVRETLRSISKVLRVATETIRTRYRKIS